MSGFFLNLSKCIPSEFYPPFFTYHPHWSNLLWESGQTTQFIQSKVCETLQNTFLDWSLSSIIIPAFEPKYIVFLLINFLYLWIITQRPHELRDIFNHKSSPIGIIFLGINCIFINSVFSNQFKLGVCIAALLIQSVI